MTFSGTDPSAASEGTRTLLRAAGPGLAVFLVAFAVYSGTLCPTISAGDSGELATAAAQLGIAHPPGFPLWTLLGRTAVAFAPGGELLAYAHDRAGVRLLDAATGRTVANLIPTPPPDRSGPPA